MRKFLLRSWVVLGVLFLCWIWRSYEARGFSETILRDSSTVRVRHLEHRIEFAPVHAFDKILIFFPGALVDPEAYAPLGHALAERGYQVVVVKMPWRMAQYGFDDPRTVQLFADTTKAYFLAGHSQGGAMAARFVREKLAPVQGLILIGTTHPKDFDLSQVRIPVMKMYGLNDGIANVEDVLANRTKLPPHTVMVPIPGGNHSQFGYYGLQLGDRSATISRVKQLEVVVGGISSFMQ